MLAVAADMPSGSASFRASMVELGVEVEFSVGEYVEVESSGENICRGGVCLFVRSRKSDLRNVTIGDLSKRDQGKEQIRLTR